MIKLKKILMAEDDPRDVEMTLKALAKHGLAHEVEVVRDGADALDYLFCRGKFTQRPPGLPAVVLLDINMPKVDGVEVLRQIKHSNSTGGTAAEAEEAIRALEGECEKRKATLSEHFR